MEGALWISDEMNQTLIHSQETAYYICWLIEILSSILYLYWGRFHAYSTFPPTTILFSATLCIYVGKFDYDNSEK